MNIITQYKTLSGRAAGVLLAGLIALVPSSCDDYLDTVPDNRMEIDNADKVTKILASAYPGNSMVELAELSTDNVRDNGAQYGIYGQNTMEAYLWQDQTTDETDAVKNLWQGHYEAITSANQALEAIGRLGNPASLDAQRGEALMCRAYAHFCLANIFCQTYDKAKAATELGIPYIKRTITEIAPADGRGTLEETYANIQQDIEQGLPLIDDQIYSVPKYHFNKNAAHAFAARFYLYTQQWAKAKEQADAVLGSDPSAKLRDWLAFSQLDTDWDTRTNAYVSDKAACNLMLQACVSTWPYVCGPYYIGRRYGCAQSIMTREILQGLWSGNQTGLYMSNGIWGFEQKYALPKFNGYFEYTDKTAGIGYLHSVNVVFSADELLSERAEAEIMLSEEDEAVSDINALLQSLCGHTYTKDRIVEYYNGIGYTPVPLGRKGTRTIRKMLHPQGFSLPSSETAEPLIQCVLHLRRVLTVHEGFRWYDIKRWGIEVEHERSGEDSDVLTVDDPRRAVQLPQEVIAAGLEANPRN